MWAAKVLKKEGIERKLIPIPRHMSSDCGFCIRIQNEEIPEVEVILKKNNIEYNGIETLSKKNLERENNGRQL